MSLATPLALTVGLASTALAGAGMGARFDFSFAKAVPAGRTVRATATGAGGTSEFSVPRTVVAA